jgi:predicted Zn-dependent protease
MCGLRRSQLLFVAAAMLAAATAFAADAPSVTSPTQEVVLGERSLLVFLQKHPETTDTAIASRVDAIGRRLSPFSDRPDRVHRAIAVAGDKLQALAFLDGTVTVTEALALKLDDDELAFAVAHEVAHIDLRHQPDRILAEDVIREATVRPSAADAALSVHDRHAEMEADRYGALYAVRAGYRFSAAASALRKLQELGGLDEDDKHPAYTERIQALTGFENELRRTVTAFDKGCAAMQAGNLTDAINYFTLFVAAFPSSLAGRVDLGAAYLSRWRTDRSPVEGLADELPILSDPGVSIRGGFGELDARNARSHFEAALRLDPDATPPRAAIALLLLREGHTAEARVYLRPLASEPGIQPEVILLLGNADYLDGAWDAASKRYQAALTARPGWNAARVNLAKALESEGKNAEAKALWELLRDDPRWGDEARRRTQPAAKP